MDEENMEKFESSVRVALSLIASTKACFLVFFKAYLLLGL